MPRVRNQSLGLADPNTEHVDRRRHLHDECHHAGNARLLSRGRRRRGGRSQHGVGARFRGAPRASRAQPIPCRPEDGTRGSAASSPRRVPPRRKCEAAVAGAAPAGGSLAARCWRTLSGRTSCLACATNPLQRPEDGTRGSAASSSRHVPPRRKCEAAVAGAAPAARDRSTDVVTQSARRRVRRYEERKRKPSYGEHNVR